MKKSTFLHLRIPFSFFLLPVFLFASSIAKSFYWDDFLLIFFILHLFLYPASNGYNSYFDKDEGSIGGLKNPPKVSKNLYYASLIFDLIALGLGLLISFPFTTMLLIYGLASKAYSHPAIRLKKMPISGWLTAGFFQGYFTWMMVYLGLKDISFQELFLPEVQIPAILSSVLLLGSYPMTQVYQHEEDGGRGDQTLSLLLGVLGTFHFTAAIFTFSSVAFCWYFINYFTELTALVFLGALSPVLIYFGFWYLQVRQSIERADYQSTMQLNFISSICLNVFFTWLLFS